MSSGNKKNPEKEEKHRFKMENNEIDYINTFKKIFDNIFEINIEKEIYNTKNYRAFSYSKNFLNNHFMSKNIITKKKTEEIKKLIDYQFPSLSLLKNKNKMEIDNINNRENINIRNKKENTTSESLFDSKKIDWKRNNSSSTFKTFFHRNFVLKSELYTINKDNLNKNEKAKLNIYNILTKRNEQQNGFNKSNKFYNYYSDNTNIKNQIYSNTYIDMEKEDYLKSQDNNNRRNNNLNLINNYYKTSDYLEEEEYSIKNLYRNDINYSYNYNYNYNTINNSDLDNIIGNENKEKNIIINNNKEENIIANILI